MRRFHGSWCLDGGLKIETEIRDKDKFWLLNPLNYAKVFSPK